MNFLIRSKEICLLRKFFNANGFTDNVFYGKLRKFLDKIYTPITKKHGCPKLNLYFRIPYLRDNTNNFFREEIAKIFRKYFPQIRPIVVFYNHFKIRNFVNHKEKLAPSFESRIVYGYNCSNCQLAYVGSTKNTLVSRVLAHKGVSIRTGLPLSSPSFSAIRNHLNEGCNHHILIEDFKILYRGRTESDIRIAESMFIKKLRPELNNDLSCIPLRFY